MPLHLKDKSSKMLKKNQQRPRKRNIKNFETNDFFGEFFKKRIVKQPEKEHEKTKCQTWLISKIEKHSNNN